MHTGLKVKIVIYFALGITSLVLIILLASGKFNVTNECPYNYTDIGTLTLNSTTLAGYSTPTNIMSSNSQLNYINLVLLLSAPIAVKTTLVISAAVNVVNSANRIGPTVIYTGSEYNTYPDNMIDFNKSISLSMASTLYNNILIKLDPDTTYTVIFSIATPAGVALSGTANGYFIFF